MTRRDRSAGAERGGATRCPSPPLTAPGPAAPLFSSDGAQGRAMPSDEERVARYFDEAELRREATAYHEAAHIVCAFISGLEIREEGADIRPGFGYYGTAAVGEHFTPEEKSEAFWAALKGGFGVPAELRTRLEADIICSMVGAEAARRAVAEGLVEEEEPLPDDPLERELLDREEVMTEIALADAAENAGEKSLPSDDDRIQTLLRAVSASEREGLAYGCWLYERTATLVRSHEFWIPCCALAQALIEREKLSGSEIRDLLSSSH